MAGTQSWQMIAQSKQQILADSIAAVEPPIPPLPEKLPLNVSGLPRDLLATDIITITEKTAEQLVKELSEGIVTSTAVTKAFLQRAALASKLTNCVTELISERALERAKFLDEYYAAHRKPIGPLHGLPISVKEHVSMKGLDCNAAFVAWVGATATDDALILKLLWKAGCVFYVRTTEPQTLMQLETSSNIYGLTVNPFNTNLTSGGSSGGEGALIGGRGSCLGVGTDIGGSIRVPAANNGLFGLRPTSYRLPMGGIIASMLGQEHIVPVVGPLSTSLDGVKLFMQALIDQSPWLYEPSLVPLPWKSPSPSLTLLRRGPDGQRRLRIGIIRDDGIVKPHPPILRGIEFVVDRLRAHPDLVDLVDFPPYQHAEAWRIIASLYFADGGAEDRALLATSGEPWRPLSRFILDENPHVRALSIPEMWALTRERDAYRDAYTQHWDSVGTALPGPDDAGTLQVEADGAERDRMVDVVLCPAGPGCAPPFDCARYWCYTSQWNLLDYPALIFPTGLACGPQDRADTSYQPRNAQDTYNHNLYSPETYVDAPISLQLVGRRYEDEKVIEALEMILDLAKL